MDTTLSPPIMEARVNSDHPALYEGGPQTESELEELLSRPTAGVLAALTRMSGDYMLLGASGKMGPTLARMVRRGLDEVGKRSSVTAVARFSNPAAEMSLRHAGVATLKADLLDAASVSTLPDAGNVFFMAGQKFGTAKHPELAWAMNTIVPAYVAERYKSSRMLVFSTGCVYPNTTVDSGGSVEGDDLAPLGDYANSCVGRERVFGWFSHKHHTPLSIFRLNYSVDLRYGVLVDVAQKVLRGVPVDVTMGYTNLIWQGDANARAVQCLEQASVPPFVLNVTGGEIVSIREVALHFARIFGREALITGREADTALLSNAARSVELFGEHQVSVNGMVQWVAEWLSRGGHTLDRPTHYERFDGKY